ncbi:MAG TPA: carotenoid biosynthesis protein [Ktedonobacteraceae bacterium]|nr:carotenoid biosynthesis protein [Ktedonobacteraceae bacterium]
MRIVKVLFTCHLAALICGLGVLLIIAPHPQLWDTNPVGVAVFEFVLRSAGTLQIIFGAATMFFFGLLGIGPRKTLIFFAASILVTLGIELLNSRVGFPSGISSATPLADMKVAGLVSYSILLTWFYMGFTSYLLANKLAAKLELHRQALWSLVLGTYFLMTWDLALSASLARQGGSTQIWHWQEYASYFGLPMSSLAGWTLDVLILLTVCRLLWRSNLDTRHVTTWVPFGVYTVNTGFAMMLSLGSGLWFTPFLLIVFVLFPESLVLVPGNDEIRASPYGRGRAALSQSVWLVMRGMSLVIGWRTMVIQVEGVEHVPQSGPVLVAARHFHYFYDGFILVHAIPRRLHTIVALDWVTSRKLRLVIELACLLADWPVVLRSEQFHEHEPDKQWAYTPIEARQYLRQLTRAAVRLFRSGEMMVIFPEGYPNIDPHPTPKPDLEAFMPFKPGFAKLIELAEKDRKTRVAIVPAGLSYTREQDKRWHTTVRFGYPHYRSDFDDIEQLVSAVEQDVRELSEREGTGGHKGMPLR